MFRCLRKFHCYCCCTTAGVKGLAQSIGRCIGRDQESAGVDLLNAIEDLLA